MTDGAGWFSLERLPSSGLEGEGGGQAITVYKPGYGPWSNLFVFPTRKLRQDQSVPRAILLERIPERQNPEDVLRFIEMSTIFRLGTNASPRLWDTLQREQRNP